MINMDKNMLLSFVGFLREIYESKLNMRLNIDLEKFSENYNEDEAYLQSDKNKQTQTNNLTFNQEMNNVKNTFGNEQFNEIFKANNYKEFHQDKSSNENNYIKNQKFSNFEHRKENLSNKNNSEPKNIKQIDKNSNLDHHYFDSEINKNYKTNQKYRNDIKYLNYIENERKDEDENSIEDNYENLEIRTIASQNITSGEKKKKYSFSKTYETDRDDKPDSENRNIYPIPISYKENSKIPLVDKNNFLNKKNVNNSPLRDNIQKNGVDKSPTRKVIYNKSLYEKSNHVYSVNEIQTNKKESPPNPQSKIQKNENLPRNPSISNMKFIPNTKQPSNIKMMNASKLDIIQAPSRPITPTRGRKQINARNEMSNILDIPLTNRNNLDLSHLSNNKSRSVSATPSCSEIENKNHSYLYIRNNRDVLPINTKFDYNKVYSKRERAELNLIRGTLLPTSNTGSAMGSKINHQVEINNYKLNLFKFLRPTLPIINIDFISSLKYLPSAEYLKNSMITNKTNNTNKEKLNRKDDYMNIDENRNEDEENIDEDIHNSIRETDILYKNNSGVKSDYSTGLRKLAPGPDYLQKEQTDSTKLNKYSNTAISSTLKNKIYFWLVDLNILKENAIKVDDIPLLCTNGVLLCDLINRLEGKSETIKGIIRKTSTKTHIQININKVLEYLRNIGKVNNRHLWSGMEIATGDEKTVWEFLDDLWYFYSNKNHDIATRRKKKKIPIPIAPNHNNFNSDSLIPKLDFLQNFSDKITQRSKDEPIQVKMVDPTNNINIKLNHQEINEEIQKCADFATIQKNISNEISNAFNKTSKHSNSNLNKRSESNEKYTNSEIIAKNLGLTKIKKKGDPVSNISQIANSHNNSVQNTSHQYPELKKAQSNNNIVPGYSSRPGSARSNINSRTKSNNPITPRNNESKSKDKQKDCFVIFQKTNAKKLQKEIERYHSLVSASGYNSENSVMMKNEDTGSVIDQNNLDNNTYTNKLIPNKNNIFDEENINWPRPFTKNQPKPTKNPYSPHEIPILITEESNHPSKIHKVGSSEIERLEMVLKEWLMSIGSKSAYKIDFTMDEIEEFKDGILLAEIISILENRKVSGINMNAKSKDAYLKNISKCLEILRNKKNMPYDYLWSEEEIAKGNSQVIKSLLNHIKKAYQKESEFIQNQINKKR